MQNALYRYCFNWSATITSALFRRMCTHMPRKVRRLVYMSSILGLFTGVHPDMELVGKLNRILQLAHDPEAYKWSIQVKSFIWNQITGIMVGEAVMPFDIDHLRKISEESVREAGHAFAKQAPAWLNYGSTDLMASDAATIMIQLRELAA